MSPDPRDSESTRGPYSRRSRREVSEGLLSAPDQGMTHTAYVMAEIGADCLFRASFEWRTSPDAGTWWALPALAMLAASFDGWTAELLVLLHDRIEKSDRARAEKLLYEGTTVAKFDAIPHLCANEPNTHDLASLRLIGNLRHEVMHPLPMPQGMPKYMSALADRGLLLENDPAAAQKYAPFQLIMSYPLAYWAWHEANEAALYIHEVIGGDLFTSSYQWPVGLHVPPQCKPIRWHTVEVSSASPPSTDGKAGKSVTAGPDRLRSRRPSRLNVLRAPTSCGSVRTDL